MPSYSQWGPHLLTEEISTNENSTFFPRRRTSQGKTLSQALSELRLGILGTCEFDHPLPLEAVTFGYVQHGVSRSAFDRLQEMSRKEDQGQ
jgi:hypothetical protein